jgi:dihydroneopterin aldolase
MTTARLFLSGIAASGRHGARPGEKDEPQDFVIDLDLEVEVGADAIEATADYRGVAERALAFDHVTRVTAVVHKPNAARRLGIDGVAAAVTLPDEP